MLPHSCWTLPAPPLPAMWAKGLPYSHVLALEGFPFQEGDLMEAKSSMDVIASAVSLDLAAHPVVWCIGGPGASTGSAWFSWSFC